MITMASCFSTVARLGRSFARAGYGPASSLRIVARVTSALLKAPEHPNGTASQRHLFTAEFLEIPKYGQERRNIRNRLGDRREKFYELLQQKLNEEDSTFFMDDVFNLIYSCDTDEKTIDLLKQVILKYTKQDPDSRLGTVFMRFAHYINNPDLAMLITQKEYSNFFFQMSAPTIAMDLLYENGRYEDVIKVFDFVSENYKFKASKYPADYVAVFMASCYKLNTIEAFDSAYRLVRKCKVEDINMRLRSVNLFVALALNQNQSGIALEVLDSLSLRSFPVQVQSLRVLALAKNGRIRDVFKILDRRIRPERILFKDMVICKDTLDELETIIAKKEDEQLTAEFTTLREELESNGLVQQERMLENYLLEPIARFQGSERRENMRNMY